MCMRACARFVTDDCVCVCQEREQTVLERNTGTQLVASMKHALTLIRSTQQRMRDNNETYSFVVVGALAASSFASLEDVQAICDLYLANTQARQRFAGFIHAMLDLTDSAIESRRAMGLSECDILIQYLHCDRALLNSVITAMDVHAAAERAARADTAPSPVCTPVVAVATPPPPTPADVSIAAPVATAACGDHGAESRADASPLRFTDTGDYDTGAYDAIER